MIQANIKKILKEIPKTVTVVAAVKGRSPEEISLALDAGIRIIGENYVKEAEKAAVLLKRKVPCHMIGHLQRNKVKKAVALFDMIQTLDSLPLAEMIDKECAKIGKKMPVLIEVNCGEEPQKSGVMPQDLELFIEAALSFPNLRLQGLMTMGPLVNKEDQLRLYFQETKKLFDDMKQIYRGKLDQWQFLSMGMSGSFRCAMDEGANMIRLGTILFGPRNRERS